MILGSDRNAYRQVFFDTWQKYNDKIKLEPLEQQLIHIILQHPEYHRYLNQPERYLDAEFFPEAGDINPFLHLSLHQAIIDQLQLDRPKGILSVYQRLLIKMGEPHQVEHVLMEHLIAGLQRLNQGESFMEQDYLLELEAFLQSL